MNSSSSTELPRAARNRVFWISVLALALPVAAQMLLQSFLGMADVIMVGHLGASAIAAVGLAAKIHFLLLVLMSGLATGCSVLIAQYMGAKDMARSQKTLAVTLFVGTVIMLPLVLVFALGATTWLPWINPDPEVTLLTAQYLMITAPVLLLTQWIVIYEASLRSLGDTGMPLVAGLMVADVVKDGKAGDSPATRQRSALPTPAKRKDYPATSRTTCRSRWQASASSLATAYRKRWAVLSPRP